MGWRHHRDRFGGDGFGDQEGSGPVENALGDGLQARLGHQIAKPAGRRVVDLSLDAGDTDVINEPTPYAVSISVDNHQPPAGPQDTPHLGDRPILAGIMVKAIGAGDDVKRSGGKRQSFAVSLNG